MSEYGWAGLSKQLLYEGVFKSRDKSPVIDKPVEKVSTSKTSKISPLMFLGSPLLKNRSCLFEKSSLMAITAAYIPPPSINKYCEVVDRYNRPKWNTVRNLSINQLLRHKSGKKLEVKHAQRHEKLASKKSYSFSHVMTVRDKLHGPTTNHIKT